MTDLIVIFILIAILGFSSYYIYRSKKNGKKCIGCPGKCSDCVQKGDCLHTN